MEDYKSFLKKLSTKPGVYRMLNQEDKVIYIGKARNLKNRVGNYFQKNLTNRKTAALMAHVAKIEVTITGSDNEALLLEANLIKQYRPRYNVLMRDDKSYPYLFLSIEDKFPRLDFHRGAKRQKGRYFGPYPSAGSVRENLALIQKLFLLRQCANTFFRNRTRPCLQYQIKRCTAPCVGYVSEADYAEQVHHAILFLEGKNAEIVEDLADKMEAASECLQYEQAAYYRDLIIRLRQLQEKQAVSSERGNIDIWGIAETMGYIALAILYIRGGRLIGHKTFFPNVPIGTRKKDALSAFLPQYYLSALRAEEVVSHIVVTEQLTEKQWIQNALCEQLQRKIIIIDQQRAKYRQWQRVALANATFALSQQLAQKDSVSQKLVAVQQALKLPNVIERIECFDISHTMGEATVASCVVYGAEGPLNKEYRHFNIKDITSGDDYAAMRQVLMRRYTRLKAGDGVLPDLIIIDGGKGQLKQAVEVLEELQITGVFLLGVAKGPSRKPGLEQLFLWGRTEPIHLAADSIALHLIQYIRDESHRFAITAHRQKRAHKRTESPLEHIEGIGAKRRKALLRHFGGLQELKKASVAEITRVSGISQSLAQKVYDALH